MIDTEEKWIQRWHGTIWKGFDVKNGTSQGFRHFADLIEHWRRTDCGLLSAEVNAGCNVSTCVLLRVATHVEVENVGYGVWQTIQSECKIYSTRVPRTTPVINCTGIYFFNYIKFHIKTQDNFSIGSSRGLSYFM